MSGPVKLARNGEYWQASWIDSAGRRQRRGLGPRRTTTRRDGLTRREAEERCFDLAVEHRLNPRAKDAKGAPTLADWQRTYMEIRQAELSEVTQKYHALTFRYLIEMFGSDRRLDKISHADADDWRARLATRMSETSVCHHVRNAKVIFGRAIKRRLIGTNPMADLVGSAPLPQHDVLTLADADIQRIIDHCPTPQWRCLFALCAWAGLRRSEGRRVKRGDILWDRNRLVVRPTTRMQTTKQKRREVLLEPKPATVLLDASETIRGDWLANVPSGSAYRKAKEIIEAAGFDPWLDPFQSLRRWRDSTWRQQYPAYVVVAWLGHTDEVARRYYLDVPEELYNTDPVERLMPQIQRLSHHDRARLLDRLQRVPATAWPQTASASNNPPSAGFSMHHYLND